MRISEVAICRAAPRALARPHAGPPSWVLELAELGLQADSSSPGLRQLQLQHLARGRQRTEGAPGAGRSPPRGHDCPGPLSGWPRPWPGGGQRAQHAGVCRRWLGPSRRPGRHSAAARPARRPRRCGPLGGGGQTQTGAATGGRGSVDRRKSLGRLTHAKQLVADLQRVRESARERERDRD